VKACDSRDDVALAVNIIMELSRYVGDRLHDLLGISDKYVAEYFIGLAGKSSSADRFIQQLRDTNTVNVDQPMVAFAQELWNKVCVFLFYVKGKPLLEKLP